MSEKRCIHCKSSHVDKTGSNEWTCYECLSKWGQGKKRIQPVFGNECKVEHLPFIPPRSLLFTDSAKIKSELLLDPEFYESPPRAKRDQNKHN